MIIKKFLFGFAILALMLMRGTKECRAQCSPSCGPTEICQYTGTSYECLDPDGDGFNIGRAFKIKGDQGIAGAQGYGSLSRFISVAIIPNAMMLANVILFFLIIGAGFTIVTSAGNADKQKQASQTLTYSILGFVIIFAAYWIMQMLGIIAGVSWFS